ncbi:MAG: translation elongation factor Ts [Candidatus Omnitrophica bacterium]|nr:translation elongation factor Ts [Candidatus Omnitrophota bacterium]
MTAVSADQIKTLREQTGAGYMECKKALTEAKGSMEGAVRILRAKGAAIATEKAGREARQGVIGSYVHAGRIGVLVEVNCETDFVARNDQFKRFVNEICLQVASMNPAYVSREEVPAEELTAAGLNGEEARKAYAEKFYKEQVLLDQPYVRDPSKTVQGLLHETVNSIRENIVIRRFVRIVLGESLDSKRHPS